MHSSYTIKIGFVQETFLIVGKTFNVRNEYIMFRYVLRNNYDEPENCENQAMGKESPPRGMLN